MAREFLSQRGGKGAYTERMGAETLGKDVNLGARQMSTSMVVQGITNLDLGLTSRPVREHYAASGTNTTGPGEAALWELHAMSAPFDDADPRVAAGLYIIDWGISFPVNELTNPPSIFSGQPNIAGSVPPTPTGTMTILGGHTGVTGIGAGQGARSIFHHQLAGGFVAGLCNWPVPLADKGYEWHVRMNSAAIYVQPGTSFHLVANQPDSGPFLAGIHWIEAEEREIQPVFRV